MQADFVVSKPQRAIFSVVAKRKRGNVAVGVYLRRIVVFKARYLGNRQLRNVSRDEIAQRRAYLAVALLNLVEYLAGAGLDRLDVELVYRIPDI